MFATAAFAHINLLVAWVIAHITYTETGRAVFSVKADGRLIGRIEQGTSAIEGVSTRDHALFLYGTDGTEAVLWFSTWAELRAALANPHLVFVEGGLASRALVAA